MSRIEAWMTRALRIEPMTNAVVVAITPPARGSARNCAFRRDGLVQSARTQFSTSVGTGPFAFTKSSHVVRAGRDNRAGGHDGPIDLLNTSGRSPAPREQNRTRPEPMSRIEATTTRVQRKRQTVPAILIAACLAVPSVVPAHATVLEYGADGEATVREHVRTASLGPDASRSRKTDPIRTRLRTLARATALGHADDDAIATAGLDAATFALLFETLIQRESAFDPRAVSPKGAKGLGQLMPGTASDLGVADPFDPIANLDGAARHLVAHLETFGSVELALAAYNAGSGTVRRYDGVPPFAETRAYVDWIMRRAGIAKAKARIAVADGPEGADGTNSSGDTAKAKASGATGISSGSDATNAPSPSSTDRQNAAAAAARSVGIEDDVTLTGKVSVWEF